MGRTRCGGVSSRTVDEEDQKSMSSLMRSSERSRPRARRTSIRQLPESRSRSIGPAHQALADMHIAVWRGVLPCLAWSPGSRDLFDWAVPARLRGFQPHFKNVSHR